jgi:hypothetical protein
MNIDDLQKTWQSQEPVRQITIDVDVLLREVRRNHQHFRVGIFWRDVREVGTAMFMMVLFVATAGYGWLPAKWESYMMAAACAWVGVFMLIDRFRQKRRAPRPSDPLLVWVESSLADVEHQMWLLKNVFWWYLLLPGMALTVVYGYAAWQCCGVWEALTIVLVLWALTEVFLAWVYRLNQRWVQGEGQTRRKELRELVDMLNVNE